MSQINLSAQLVRKIESIIKEHDEGVEDPGIVAQYLAAVTGFLLGEVDLPKSRKAELLEQLKQFSQYVCDDVEGKKATQIAESEQAMGIWKPGS